MSEITPKIIEKEEITNLHFPHEEVLHRDENMKLRRSRLLKSLRLGNAYHQKVKIIFEDDKALRQVETTIWSLTEQNISLKANTLIPIRRIHSIKLY